MIPWGTVIVAVAGIAGTVGGAVLGASLTARAQASNLRQHFVFEARQDKRRIYAAALAALETLNMAKDSTTDDPEHSAKETAAGLAIGEVRLIAPHEVGDAARSALHAVLGTSDAPVDFHSAHAALLQSMRNDLGEAD